MIVTVWLLSALISIPPLLGWRKGMEHYRIAYDFKETASCLIPSRYDPSNPQKKEGFEFRFSFAVFHLIFVQKDQWVG